MKSLIITAIFSLSSLLGACTNVLGNNNGPLVTSTDSTKGFAVVELYTSEGCSSCPPADELLSRLEQESNGQPLYLLAFHVDYWDHQGWRDSYSQHAFSERQQQYASWLGLSTVYTPQMVINGTREMIGSNVAAVKQAVNTALDQPASASLILQAHSEARQLEVNWQLSSPRKNTHLLLALVQKSGQSQVRAGENAGRKLSHVQIVRQLTTVNAQESNHTTLQLPDGFNNTDWELIGFVQNSANGKIIAAAKAALH
ncbi:hypothetical protein FHW36_105341 [Chitinophaga polysaccharea]|uniref:DUF1223 domain-containing protein n=1 Tax=Chitinophaga polysaccharea TaxID=1293035 RepID=A0A561PP64_9BACT|nr:DUF1223 domain-containing protein [Chitinophaga polysaccharea]TWF39901.1 hypothetical protein FHW36_105341 [Chitinophaga polysaccharea]